MSDVRALVGRLDPACRAALERAAGRCNARGQLSVEPEHLLVELLADSGGPVARLIREGDGDPAQVAAELSRALDRIPGGSGRTPSLSATLLDLLAAAPPDAAGRVRPEAAARAMLDDPAARRLLLASAPSLGRLRESTPEAAGRPERAPVEPAPPDAVQTDALGDYATDLTAAARAGRIDPVIGRDAEIGQIIDILLRRRQNNPILTGDAGVGKTAVVEGLALRLAGPEPPAALAGARLMALDLAALQAGAGVRGEFERRLRAVLGAVEASPRPIILFIDEAHGLIGAGGQAGQGDAANLLKPALARGALRCVAATTWGEYKRWFEKDAALARRFQLVRVAEPDPDTAVAMLRGLAPRLEAHHGLLIREAALHAAVRLSQRHLTGRQLPEKAISVLDTACARVAASRSEAPPALARARSRAAALTAERDRLAREGAGAEALDAAIETAAAEAAALAARWEAERDCVARLTDTASDPSERDYQRLRLETLHEAGEPLARLDVDADAVGRVVSAWTGVPVGEMLRDGAEGARDLLDRLGARVIAQDGALETIGRRILTWFAQLAEPGKPTGVFLLAGPSGVGKTETAAALADALFGGPQALTTVNMTEYQEAHSVSGLKGAPPGYVGYGRGGLLTEALRRRPYCVLLLDEIEKAHRDVVELFYQAFDKGYMEDAEGQPVDFRNAVILMTTNVGADTIAEAAAQGMRDPGALAAAIRPDLLRAFPAAFLGRLAVAPYLPLGPAELTRIAEMKLDQLRDRLAASHGVGLSCDRAVLEALVARAVDAESGARAIEALVADALAPRVAALVLDALIAGRSLASIHVTLGADRDFVLDAR